MFQFLRKTLLHAGCFITHSPAQNLYFLRNHHPSLSSFRCISTTANQQSFTVSYLIRKCGLSPESALSASKRVDFETPDKPDSVINFFNNHGFSKTQISTLVRKLPQLLLVQPQKTLLPKLEFFHSKGFSSLDLSKVLSSYPWILLRSLQNHLVPLFIFFETLFKSDEKLITSIKRFPGIICRDLETELVPKINILRDNGMSETNIVRLLLYYPRTLVLSNSDRIKALAQEVREMGLNPSQWKFVMAMVVLLAASKSTWERRVDAYKRWGLSKEEILLAFGRYPFCMAVSEDKIMAIMDLFVNKLGWGSYCIVLCPTLVTYSFEKRLIPRASVLQFLISKGLLKKDFRAARFFTYSEKKFLQKFVNCYVETSQLLDLYKEKVDLSG